MSASGIANAAWCIGSSSIFWNPMKHVAQPAAVAARPSHLWAARTVLSVFIAPGHTARGEGRIEFKTLYAAGALTKVGVERGGANNCQGDPANHRKDTNICVPVQYNGQR